MSLRLNDLATALSSSDARLVASTCESLYKAVAAEGFNRFNTPNGQQHTQVQTGGADQAEPHR